MRVGTVLLLSYYVLFGLSNAFIASLLMGIVTIADFGIKKSFMNGVLWLLPSIGHIVSPFLYAYRNRKWWILELFSMICSQILIVIYWDKLMRMSALSIISLIIILFAIVKDYFISQIEKEIAILISCAGTTGTALNESTIEQLPSPVQRWIRRCGIMGKKSIQCVHLKQEFTDKFERNQISWKVGESDQYITQEPPSFITSSDIQYNPFVFLIGKEKFSQGKGALMQKILAMFKYMDLNNNKYFDESLAQKYLADIIWCPSASLSKYIKWIPINDYSAEAVFLFEQVSGSGIFEFDSDGNPKRFRCNRYFRDGISMTKKQWMLDIQEYAAFDGLLVPLVCNFTWRLDDGDWLHQRMRINDASFSYEA